jgi:hypothetical protein
MSDLNIQDCTSLKGRANLVHKNLFLYVPSESISDILLCIRVIARRHVCLKCNLARFNRVSIIPILQ